MNAHTPFDANQDWTNPYCQNSSNDPMVDALLGNAYHVVRTVYCNLGNLKLIYDFLQQYGMVLGVQSEAELKALTTKATFARIYDKSPAGDRRVTDYLYVEGDRTGILPDDTTATGSWVKVATSGSSGGGGESTNDGGYIPWIYNSGSAIGGETTIRIPDETVGAPFMIVNGDWQTEGYDFEYDPVAFEVSFTTPLEPGDFVVVMRTGVPASPDNPNISDWVTINWLYNNGAAVGGEQVIDIPYTFQSVPAVYKNGLRFYKALPSESYTVDSDSNRIFLTEPLATNDRLIVQLGGEANVLEVVDHTIQEVARSANVKDSEVILSTNTTQVLNGKTVVYDVAAQRIYGLPLLPTNVYINTVSNGQLTYFPGNITVDLSSVPNSASALEDRLASSTEPGASLVMVSSGKTVEEMFNLSTYVFPGDDLKAALESANNGDTVIVSGDVTLNQSVVIQKAVSIKRANGGRILWNGASNNCIRYVLPVKNTITSAVQFLQGTNTATFPAGHGVVVGDCLEAHSTSVRFTDLGGSTYTRGQLFFVEAVDGNTVTFTPNVIEGFTSSEILVTDTLRGMDFDVEIVTVKAPTGSPTGVLMDIHCARDMTGKFRIKGNEDEQYGLAVTGHNNQFDVDVWGITSGYGQVSVPGYGVNVAGTDMRITGSGGRCRHVFEIPSGNVLSANIEFDMHIVKSANTPLFLYAAGAHANAVGWKARGSVSGSGYLIGDRTGTADISMDFFHADDGYEYADVYFADIHPYSARVHDCRTFGETARKNFIFYNCSGTIRNGSTLVIENNIFRGPTRLIQFKNDAAVANPVYAAIIRNNIGQAVAFTNRDLTGANVTLTIEGNKLGSYGITTTYSDYMLGIDATGCRSYELHMHHNLLDDTLPQGVLQLLGNIENLNLDVSYCSNGAKPMFNIVPSYLGAIGGFSIDHAKTSGLMTFTIPLTTTFNAAANVSFCDIKYDSTTPISSTNVPIIFTGNSFKTTFDATLVSTKSPQAGNVNLSGKSLNWNGTNIAI